MGGDGMYRPGDSLPHGGEPAYRVGDYVSYGDDGVCRVDAVGPLTISSRYAAAQTYYTLKPLSYKGIIYAPTAGGAPIRPLITPEEARALLLRLPQLPGGVSYAGDRRQLADYYRRQLREGTCEAFARTAKGIYEKYHAPGRASRLPNEVEMRYFKLAAELLVQELSIVLDQPQADIQARIETICGIGPGQAIPRSNPA